MAGNTTYMFVRPESKDLPPRFSDVSSRLEIIGIYGAILEHPQADWNRITLTFGENKINVIKLEKIFKHIGYVLSQD